ncbi:MAG: response regulator [Magnetococcales bacterium]|nr:response regulator [Magnetococcales bacterium]
MDQVSDRPLDNGKDRVPLPPAILLVEDSEENRLVIRAFLRGSGCRVEIADHGAEAVEKFKKDSFAVVLMDLQMPVMDGNEATRQIRAWEAVHGNGSRTPIVVLTAHSSGGELQQCLDNGCDLFLTKPIRKQILLDAIQPWIGGGAR